MAISVTCPECGYGFSVRDEYAGRRGKCPQCQGVFRAEAAPAADEFPAIVTSGGRANGSSRRNGSSASAPLGDLAASGPALASAGTTSVASAYAARRRSSGLPLWGWIAIGVALLVSGGAIGGAWALAPDPLEIKKEVAERTQKAEKAYSAFEEEIYDKVFDVDEKLNPVDGDIKEFAREKTLDADVIPGVVKVLNLYSGQLQGSGTGWIANDQHWIVTNHHVVRGCETLQVQTADGKKHDVEGFIACRPEWDLAVIKPKEKIPGGKPLPIAPNDGSYLPNAGDKVWAIGNPASHMFTATRGVITRRVSQRQLINEASQTDTAWMIDTKHDIMRIEHDARIFPGNSGGPLLDEHFRVIGVNTLLEMLPLEQALEKAKKDRQPVRLTPTFGLASNSMYTLDLVEEFKEGKVRPLEDLPTEEP